VCLCVLEPREFLCVCVRVSVFVSVCVVAAVCECVVYVCWSWSVYVLRMSVPVRGVQSMVHQVCVRCANCGECVMKGV